MRHVQKSVVLSSSPSVSEWGAGRTFSNQSHGLPGTLPILELYSKYQPVAIK